MNADSGFLMNFVTFILISQVLSGCASGKPSDELLNRLVAGSEFGQNDVILNDEGWWRLEDAECTEGQAPQSYTYLDFSDPSYSLTLEYDGGCNLLGKTVEKRNVNEL